MKVWFEHCSVLIIWEINTQNPGRRIDQSFWKILFRSICLCSSSFIRLSIIVYHLFRSTCEKQRRLSLIEIGFSERSPREKFRGTKTISADFTHTNRNKDNVLTSSVEGFFSYVPDLGGATVYRIYIVHKKLM